MKKLIMGFVGVAALAAYCGCPVDSGTTFAKEALAPYVEKGHLPGAISVFYKDGVQET